MFYVRVDKHTFIYQPTFYPFKYLISVAKCYYFLTTQMCSYSQSIKKVQFNFEQKLNMVQNRDDEY